MANRPPSRRNQAQQGQAAVVDPQNVATWARAYHERELDTQQVNALQTSLAANPNLQQAFDRRLKMLNLMEDNFEGVKVSENFDDRANHRLATRNRIKAERVSKQLDTSSRALSAVNLGIRQPARGSEAEDPDLELAEVQAEAQPGWAQNFGAAPWWLISTALHALIILLMGLVTMAVQQENLEGEVVVTTELAAAKEIQTEPEKKPQDAQAALETKRETPATDPDSQVQSDIVVPPDILAKAELGDHFETINPDRPDTHSAFGNPDAHMFHSEHGSDDEAGGGGNEGLALDEVIGIGGGGSPGTGGGWGGGHGTGVGVDKGSGKGSFGQRGGGGRRLMVMRHGGSKATESAVDTGLDWLARNQEADGHWDVMKHQGKNNVDAGITALGVLAFLGAGHTEKVGKYKDHVSRAVKWIISKQEADGSIGKEYKEFWHPGYAYHHAMCGLALAEAAAMGRLPATVEAAQKAILYTTETHQAGDGSEKTAWRYLPKKDIDASVSGWFVMQLKSAKIAGLPVNPASFEGALRFYDSIEIKDPTNGYGGGKFPYQKGGTVALNTTSIGILCNLFLGRKPDSLMGGAEYLSQNLPKWDAKLGQGGVNNGSSHFPLYYTYYSTLTMFQMGGQYWKGWNEALKAMLLPNQRKGGAEDGSWDPLGGKDDEMGGRVYMTAMAALCLEVYYRYLPITR